MSAPDRLLFVDGLRGFAAMWVVAFHVGMSGQIDRLRQFLPGPVFELVFDAGHLGIWVFFVLSGFVMAMAVEGRRIDGAFVANFLTRRIIRLALPYYFSIAISLGVLALRAANHHEPVAWPGIGALGAHFLLLQEVLQLPHLNVVYWTLAIEVQFYVVFALLSWALCTISSRMHPQERARAERVRSIGLAAVAAASLTWPFGLGDAYLWPGDFAPFFYAFLGGVLARAAYRGDDRARWLLGAFGITVTAAPLVTHHQGPLVVALTCAVIAMAPALAAVRMLLEWPPLRFCGLVSYSLYLLHPPVILFIGSVVHHFPGLGAAAWLASLVSIFGISLAAAFVMWRWVELPAQQLGRRTTIGKPAVPVAG